MFVGIYLIAVYDPSSVVNDGFHDLVDVIIPEGTILNPVRPAALSCRTHLLGRLMDVLSGLLGQKAPEFMTAAGFSDSPHFMYSGKMSLSPSLNSQVNFGANCSQDSNPTVNGFNCTKLASEGFRRGHLETVWTDTACGQQ